MSIRASVTQAGEVSTRYLRLARWLVAVERDLIQHAWRYAGVSNSPTSKLKSAKTALSSKSKVLSKKLTNRQASHQEANQVAPSEKSLEKTAAFSELSRHWAKALVQLMQENGGTWIKVGQFLSCRPDILPPEFIEALSTLQTKAKPVPFEKIYPILTSQWGNQWESQFSAFDVLPQNTASIAQVYRARLASGEAVAVKVLLPGVVEAFAYDAKLLRWLAVALNRLLRGFDWVAVIEQFITMTEQEFDLECELKNIEQFHKKRNHQRVEIPQVFPALSGPKVLVMGWLTGEPLGDYIERLKAQGNNEIAMSLLSDLARLYVQQISQDGLFHADPHPGNLLALPEDRLGLLDFGAVGRLSSEQRLAFNGLLAMLFGYESPQFASQLELAGFRGIDEQVMARLSAEIVASKSTQDFSRVLETLLDILRVARVEMPGAFVAVIRVLMTVSGYLSKYNLDFEHFKAAVTGS